MSQLDIPSPRASDMTERPLKDLVKEVWENSETLLRQEFQLAVTELDVRAGRAKREVGRAAAGGAVLYAGVLALLAALILLLSKAMDPWVASLIVGGVAVITGAALLAKAKKEAQPENLKPDRTIRTVKRDAQMLKEATR